MANPLVIVESPAKAKTISSYLGDDYVVESSIGHVRDLPAKAAEIPAKYKKEKWASLGIDVDNDFKPIYVVSERKKEHVEKLKKLISEASELVLATDEDREGEAIAWHLIELLKPKIPVKRMVFHEITPEAISRAIDNPRELDRRLVNAQEARRLLDRLYGYEISPVVWKKVKPRLSAGRVQSVATRIVVERERERMAFRSANYWDITGTFEADASKGEEPFTALMHELDGKRIASGRDFKQDGELSRDVVHLDQVQATALVADLRNQPATVVSREAKPYRRSPSAPFITSTFQQEAGRKLRLSSAQAMRVAQGLYERGFITYMRTDSTTLSGSAVEAARAQIKEKFGPNFVPEQPRTYKSKVKNAQEAHEAIRPAGDTFRTPSQVTSQLSAPELRVYELIWQRTVASQMTDATGETVTLKLAAETSSAKKAVFSTSGTVIKHKGFLAVYGEVPAAGAKKSTKDADPKAADEKRLPALEKGDKTNIVDLEAVGHDTQPPARFTEASLVKRLEELGVGRPSTYASTMGTIQARGYVWKKGSALVPSFLAFAVVTLLENHFPDLIDYAFTARMEDDLDNIAEGSIEVVPWLSKFYFGADDEPGLKEKIEERLGEIDARAINSILLGADDDGVPIVARIGRFGLFLERGEETKSIPDDIPPDELSVAVALEKMSIPDLIKLGAHPESDLPVYVRDGKFGPYVQLGDLPEKDKYTEETKPQTSSLFKDMVMTEVTLDQAVELLTIPRTLGADPADGREIVAKNGPHGPYLFKEPLEEGKRADTRSFDDERDLLTIDLAKALALYAEPKRRRGQSAAGPLKELGVDPTTDLPVIVKTGRFGDYVTDGEVNASLTSADSVERIDITRASELLAIRRQKLALDPEGSKKATKKKATKKKSAKKKATKKKTAKKSAKKKSTKKATKKSTATKTASTSDDKPSASASES